MISIVLPCRDEQEALPSCLTSLQNLVKQHNLDAEIIVSDSSSDNSPAIAKQYGARLIKHDKVGYGIAYQEGVKAADGNIIVMLDADGTYDIQDIPLMIKRLQSGYDFAIGNRFGKKINTKAMPHLHRRVGNHLLSMYLRMLYRSTVRDAHCGLRAIKKEAYDRLCLESTGMEYASEMVVRAKQHNLQTFQFNTNYFERIGTSKLVSLRDGWRHIRFLTSNRFLGVPTPVIDEHSAPAEAP